MNAPDRRAQIACAAAPAALGFLATAAMIGMLGLLAHLLHRPLLFPSLGPTAILLVTAPDLPASRPRNALAGHVVGIICGAASLLAFGLLDTPANLHEVSMARALCAALALALTTAITTMLRSPHPPAGATTLIIALGLMRTPAEWATIMAAVIMLTTLSQSSDWIRNRNRNRNRNRSRLVGDAPNTNTNTITITSAAGETL